MYPRSILAPFFEDIYAFQTSDDYATKEEKDGWWVAFDLPGMKREDIKVEIEGKKAIIHGERPKTDMGLPYGKFKRTFRLPYAVNMEKARAEYEDGVLKVFFPKDEKDQAKRIEVT